MADEQNQQQPAEQTEQAESAGGLRKQLEQVLAENKELKAFRRTAAFKDAGFDPDSGTGKALSKLYEGDADPAKIREFAAEYGWEPTTGNADKQLSDAELARLQANARVDQVNAASTPSDPPSLEQQIDQAEAAGDWAKAGALKNQLLNQQFYGSATRS